LEQITLDVIEIELFGSVSYHCVSI